MNLGSILETRIPSCEWCGCEMVSRQALYKDGGQALDLLTIALKTDSNKPMHREFYKRQNVLGYTEIFLHSQLVRKHSSNPVLVFFIYINKTKKEAI